MDNKKTSLMSETGVNQSSNIFISLAQNRLKTEKKPRVIANSHNYQNSYLSKTVQNKRKNMSMPPETNLKNFIDIDFDGPLIPNKKILKKAAMKIFKFFDFNKSEKLEKCEIEIIDDLIKKEFGISCRNKENDYSQNFFMRLLDYDCDGKISCEDFLTFFISRFSHSIENRFAETVKPMPEFRESSILENITDIILNENENESGEPESRSEKKNDTEKFKEDFYVERDEDVERDTISDIIESEVYVVQENIENIKEFKPKKSKVEFVEVIPRSEHSISRDFQEVEEEEEDFGDVCVLKGEPVKESHCEEIKLSRTLFESSESFKEAGEKEKELRRYSNKNEYFVAMNTISEEEESPFETYDHRNSVSKASSSSRNSSSSSKNDEEEEHEFLKKSTKVEFHYADVINLPLQAFDTSLVHSVSQNNPFILKKVEVNKVLTDEENDDEDGEGGDVLDLRNCSPEDTSREILKTEYNSVTNQFLMYKSVEGKYDSIRETIIQLEKAESNMKKSSTKKESSNRKIRELYSSRSKSRKNSIQKQETSDKEESVSKNTLNSRKISNFSEVTFSANSLRVPSSSDNSSKGGKPDQKGIKNPVLSSNKSKIRPKNQESKISIKSTAPKLSKKSEAIKNQVINKSSSMANNINKHFKEDEKKIQMKLKSMEHSQQLSVIEGSENEEDNSLASKYDSITDKKESIATLESAMSDINKKYEKMKIIEQNSKISKVEEKNKHEDKEKSTGRFGKSNGITEEANSNKNEEESNSRRPSKRYKNSKNNSLNNSQKETEDTPGIKEVSKLNSQLEKETVESEVPLNKEKSEIKEEEGKIEEENLGSSYDSARGKFSQGSTVYAGRRINFYTKSTKHERGSQVEEIIEEKPKEELPETIAVSKVIEVKDIEDLKKISPREYSPKKEKCQSKPISPKKFENHPNGTLHVVKSAMNTVYMGKEALINNQNIVNGKTFRVKKVQITSIKSEQIYVKNSSLMKSSCTISSKRSSMNPVKAMNKATFESNDDSGTLQEKKSQFLKVEKRSQYPSNLGSSAKISNVELSSKPKSVNITQNLNDNFTPKKAKTISNNLIEQEKRSNNLQSTKSFINPQNCKESKVLVSHTFRHRPKPTSSFFVNKDQEKMEDEERKKLGGRKKLLRKSHNLPPSNASILTNLTSNYNRDSKRESKSRNNVYNYEKLNSMDTSFNKKNYVNIDSLEGIYDSRKGKSMNPSPLKYANKFKRESSKCEVFVLVEGTQILNERNQMQEANKLRSRSRSDRNCSKISNILNRRLGGGKRDMKSSEKKIFDQQKFREVRENCENLDNENRKGNEKKKISMAKRLSRIK